LTERCKNGILIIAEGESNSKICAYKRSRPADDTIFAPSRQGRSAPPTAVAGAAASALQSKKYTLFANKLPLYRKFLTEPTRIWAIF